VPGRVTKLERFSVQRIAVEEGKVMVFLVEGINSFIEEERKDSEVSLSEE